MTMETPEQPNEFESVKVRLEEIAEAVDDENLSLDEALDLYEEAVKLGLQASDLLEVGIVVEEEAVEEAAEGVAADPDPSSAGTIPSSPVEQAPASAEPASSVGASSSSPAEQDNVSVANAAQA